VLCILSNLSSAYPRYYRAVCLHPTVNRRLCPQFRGIIATLERVYCKFAFVPVPMQLSTALFQFHQHAGRYDVRGALFVVGVSVPAGIRFLLIHEAEHLLNHQPFPQLQHNPGFWSLSRSGVENCIPLQTLFGLTGLASASPASPLNPDTFRRKLSDSGSTENDEYSPEYHKPESLWI